MYLNINKHTFVYWEDKNKRNSSWPKSPLTFAFIERSPISDRFVLLGQLIVNRCYNYFCFGTLLEQFACPHCNTAMQQLLRFPFKSSTLVLPYSAPIVDFFSRFGVTKRFRSGVDAAFHSIATDRGDYFSKIHTSIPMAIIETFFDQINNPEFHLSSGTLIVVHYHRAINLWNSSKVDSFRRQIDLQFTDICV